MEKRFTHLHLHTPYSLLDGFSKINETVLKAKNDGMSAVAITDHGVMFGVIDFYKIAKEHGIKPIIGCEVYVSQRTRHDKENIDKHSYHLILLAENNIGYQNLVKLVSIGFTEGYYYKPRVDIESLKKHSEGLIALSACLAGEVQRNLMNNDYESAKKSACRYRDIFGEKNFFLELQNHGISEQFLVNERLRDLSRETGIELVATNDVHYVNREDSRSHEVLLCIQMGKTLQDEGRMEFQTDEFYFKTTEEMYQLFPNDHEALYNTYRIGERCHVDFDFNVIHLPQYTAPSSYTNYEFFDRLCEQGLKKRYPEADNHVLERLEYEKSVIKNMGYVEYFLIVWDFIDYSKRNGIIVGPGRGSAAGSIVAYCLNITDVDPIKYNLLFERFLNPERISMPDIDIDFCYERREEVIDYVKQKYGEDHVAQIITFGTFGAKAAIRDVGRVLGISYSEVDKVAKEIPFALGMTIDIALSKNETLRKMYYENATIGKLIDFAKNIEGLPRHASTHAAGVVISKNRVDDYVPLYMHQNAIATQFPMTTLEELGLLKMDFLGLRTLTVIQKSLEIIEEVYGEKIDFSKMEMDEPSVYRLLSEGNTLGIFQLESNGMRAFLKEFHPENFEDIVAGISLYRPGPMESIPSYIRNKRNNAEIRYLHQKLEPILKVTNGILIYQEQVMQIVRELAGYSYARADLVRKAMSKKKMDVMEEERQYFVNGKQGENGEVLILGCVQNGISPDIANRIYDEMIDFAKYAFNKSHAACYGVLAYQTAYLKTFYPVAFMAALMTSVMGRTDKVVEYIRECNALNIKVMNPDINYSKNYFSVEEGGIRFALTSIKNVGEQVVKELMEEIRENGIFSSFFDFVNRAPKNCISKKTVESFIRAGAFDQIHSNRAELLANYESAISSVHSRENKNIAGQVSLFDSIPSIPSQSEFVFTKTGDFSIKEKLAMEKEMIGLYISGHPLDEYASAVKEFSTSNVLELKRMQEEMSESGDFMEHKTILAGVIQSKTMKYTKNNKLMAFLSLEDLTGAIEVVVFPNIIEKFLELLNEDEPILVTGAVQFKEDDEPKLIADKIESLKRKNFKKIYLQLEGRDSEVLKDIKQIIRNYPGRDRVIFFDRKNQRAFELEGYKYVSSDEIVIRKLKELLGLENIKIK